MTRYESSKGWDHVWSARINGKRIESEDWDTFEAQCLIAVEALIEEGTDGKTLGASEHYWIVEYHKRRKFDEQQERSEEDEQNESD